ncbi:MAG: hypothetical protein ABJB97_04955, partial [Acidobacteriota bacterium]
LVTQDDLSRLCDELKRRCYERGAEDNLTAIVVRCGTHIHPDSRSEDLQLTISPESEATTAATPAPQPQFAGNLDETVDALRPPSRTAFPVPAINRQEPPISTPDHKLNIPDSNASKGDFLRTLGRLLMFVLLLAVAGAAFYAGRRYKGPVPYFDEKLGTAQPTPAPAPPLEDSLLKFERSRREVDRDPKTWLGNEMTKALAAQGILNALESTDPEFLYLYGRASMLSGNTEEAARAFEQAITKSDAAPSPANATVRKEATLALAALALKSEQAKPRALIHYDEMLPKPAPSASP